MMKSPKPGREEGDDDGKSANKWGYWIALAEIDGMNIEHMPISRLDKIVLRMIVLFRKVFGLRPTYDE